MDDLLLDPKVEEREKPVPQIPAADNFGRGREVFKEALVNGNISSVLHKVGGWTEYAREIMSALASIAETTSSAFTTEAEIANSGGSLPGIAANPAILIGLLKTDEFQQVISAVLVQFLKSS